MEITQRTINREISWLEFNQRVLNEARDQDVPLLDRANFLSIVSSNLDEFYMVRVGGLKLIMEAGVTDPDPAGMRPDQQLKAIRKRIASLNNDISQAYHEEIAPALRDAGMNVIRPDVLSESQRRELETLFRNSLYPVVTPSALHPAKPFPLLSSLKLYLLLKLAPAPPKRKPRYALLPMPSSLPRFIPFKSDETKVDFLLLESIMEHYATMFFPGHRLLECVTLRLTRNADIHVDETYAPDLAKAMLEVLHQRKTSACVRLEIEGDASPDLMEWIRQQLDVDEKDIQIADCPLQLSDWRFFHGIEKKSSLKEPSWTPRHSPAFPASQSVFDSISKGDVMLTLPFESFDPVCRFIEEAADDPHVLAIKIVLYRIGQNNPIVDALCRAAINNKAVTTLIELKARFDEENNIAWAKRLECAGVQVVYGIQDLKTHAKVAMVVRQETEGIVRYLYFSTGNFNATTARLYTDVGFFTRQDELGIDTSAFFNAVCGYSEPRPYQKLIQAPFDMRERLIEMLDAESAVASKRGKARVIAKMNSLVDPDIIEALYRASSAGVTIDLIVRGICCLRPGVEGLSENIRVFSIVDRFLEHSRIFYFHRGGAQNVYIASADWMPRNLGRRIELMVPIEDRRCKQRLIDLLKANLDDRWKSSVMQPDGTYQRRTRRERSSRSQERSYQAVNTRLEQDRRMRRTQLKPHLPQKNSPQSRRPE